MGGQLKSVSLPRAPGIMSSSLFGSHSGKLGILLRKNGAEWAALIPSETCAQQELRAPVVLQ